MVYKLRKELKKLENKQIIKDIKRYIDNSNSFYEDKTPEIKILAKRLHDEYKLNDFYKVFNKLWTSCIYRKKYLAIYALEFYKEDFNIKTWKFVKSKLKDIKSFDIADYISINIIGDMIIKIPKIKKELIKLSKKKNIWIKRVVIISLIRLIKKEKTDFILNILQDNINNKERRIQEAVGFVLKEMSQEKPSAVKKFILKNIHMPYMTLKLATENMKELRKLRKIKKLDSTKSDKLFFWKEI